MVATAGTESVVDAEGAEDANGTMEAELAPPKAGDGLAEGSRSARFTEVSIGLSTLQLISLAIVVTGRAFAIRDTYTSMT